MTDLERKKDRTPVPKEWAYAPAPESRDVVALDDRYGHYVGGTWLEPAETYTTISPATEEPLAEVGQATPEEVEAAVAAARDAFENGWSGIAAAERAKYLFRIARILQERAREFAVLESLNGGKPIKESRDVDLPLAAAHFFYYAGWADKLEYAFPNRRPQPVGVAGQIIPWNFPLLMLAWKIAPALAAGNTVVLKPAETTPLSALLFADVLRQAELPAGVVNIVTGDGRAGAALVKSEGVDKIAFTGSTDVGKAIQRELAGTGKKLTLELGGKAANIIFDDAALDQAVEGIVNGIYFNQGHVCCAGSRLLVQESIYEPVVEKLKRRLTTLRVGDPLDKNTDVGAINSKQQLEKIRELVESGEEEGAEIYQPPCRLPEKGYWFAPTVFTNVAQSYRIAQEEIFGPVLSVLTFRTPEEAVEKANNTPYGLSAVSGPRRARASSGWPSVCAPASSGRTRSTGSIRRPRSAATRSPASAVRAAAMVSSPTSPSTRASPVADRLPVKKTQLDLLAGLALQDRRIEVVVVELDLDLAGLVRDVLRPVALDLRAADRRRGRRLALLPLLLLLCCCRHSPRPRRRGTAQRSSQLPGFASSGSSYAGSVRAVFPLAPTASSASSGTSTRT